MSFRDKTIHILDWAGNQLFIGDYDDPQVDKVLDVNRCTDHTGDYSCDICDLTGYKGDIRVHWVDESDKDDCNVYECINY